MSFGFKCRLCGFYEIVHLEPKIADEFLHNDQMGPEDITPGYTESYTSCPGYSSENPEAEDAAFEAFREEELEKGRIEGQQTYVWLVYDGRGILPPLIYVSNDWRG